MSKPNQVQTNAVEFDRSLIRQAQSGSRNALDQVLSPLQQPVLRFLLRFLNHADAKDVAQETFILVVRKISQFEFRSTLKSWVFRIAYRQMINFRKSNSNQPHFSIEADEVQVQSAQMAEEDRSAMVLEMVNQLPNRQREVVWLRIEEGLTYREISEICEQPLNTILSRMHQAKKRLANQLEKIGIQVRSLG